MHKVILVLHYFFLKKLGSESPALLGLNIESKLGLEETSNLIYYMNYLKLLNI